MRCPYCRNPLEPLIVQGQTTGAYQCVQCQGTWLRQQELEGLAGLHPGGGSVLSGGVRALPAPAAEPVWSSAGQSSGRGPWDRLGGDPSQSRAYRSSEHSGSTAGRTQKGRTSAASAPSSSGAGPSPSDWNICTYCGKPNPGLGPNCHHCNVERMRCPECARLMIGVRRHRVLVDMCLRCHGLWFERGRLEAMLQALYAPEDRPSAADARGGRGPSLLQQLASFLEQTEPGAYAEVSRDEVGIWTAMSSGMQSGMSGGKQLLCDLLTVLGDLEKPGGGRP